MRPKLNRRVFTHRDPAYAHQVVVYPRSIQGRKAKAPAWAHETLRELDETNFESRHEAIEVGRMHSQNWMVGHVNRSRSNEPSDYRTRFRAIAGLPPSIGHVRNNRDCPTALRIAAEDSDDRRLLPDFKFGALD